MIRTRFAPSPTGYMHIGNLRTALYAYLYARKQAGKFVLRIEDTDRKRHVPQAVGVIYNSLSLAGIEYDEGPDKDGGFGPYMQSQRLEIYKDHAKKLLEIGAAYPCFCSKGKIDQGKKIGIERRDPCRYLDIQTVESKKRDGETFVIRQKIPDSGVTSFVDHVFGTITIANTDLDDQVLLKSDGFPTYNFANVVDDYLMQITYVIRGVEYLSSTPKYNLLYDAFAWPSPEYVHLPHITKENGRKLSKRAGDASFEDLVAKGYLPEAIVNYVSLLGWNPGNDQEFFRMKELIQAFDIDRINKSNAAFSFPKLDWLNSEHIRALSLEQFQAKANNFYPLEISKKFDVTKISKMIQPRIVRLTDIPEMVKFFRDLPNYNIQSFIHEKSKSTLVTSQMTLKKILPILTSLEDWTHERLQETLKVFADETGLKLSTVMWPFRIAVSGMEVTPGGATEIADILGKVETLRRIAFAEQKLNNQ
jgi:glutamyl-tRNA synthetase